MLRIYFMQQRYALSDPAMEDALYEIESMRRFARLDLSDDAQPDETTILKFRHLLERHGLTSQMMNVVNDTLEERGLLLKGGTMVDATIIHAAPSTNVADVTEFPHLLREDDRAVFGDKGYVNNSFKHRSSEVGKFRWLGCNCSERQLIGFPKNSGDYGRFVGK